MNDRRRTPAVELPARRYDCTPKARDRATLTVHSAPLWDVL